ncbi:Hypothetical protein P9515_13971 [Prochlorococcus marinus str. MIT 9515]|uniref:Uncharacterized protein n=2 Tax=Prochlorococcus marinus TaxID=1219 RepID=A2BXU3_PROM5|nr:Hypothetical protein P9515_13971 [Prochlorococcus marinus str. MIT 9515]
MRILLPINRNNWIMNSNLIKNFKKIKYEPLNKNYFNHNLHNDFHLIAMPVENKNKLIIEQRKWNIIKSFTIDWQNLEHHKRVFEITFAKNLILYLVKDPKPKYEADNKNYSEIFVNKKSKEFQEKYKSNFKNFYITSNPRDFIEKFLLIFGFNALKFLDIKEQKLVKLKPLNKPLGTFGWKSFKEFILFANISCDWIVLRNFEFLPLNFFNNDKDIDILCRDKENFANKLNLKKRSWGISSYQTIIEDKIIPVDLRFIGDEYLDKLWQSNILKNKIYQSNLIPRPCDLDYFYSLIYHCKLQKREVKNIYLQRLYKLKNKLEMNNLNNSFISNDSITSKLLSEFLNKNKYTITKPFDINVKINKRFYKIIKILIEKSIPPKLPIFTRLRILLPIPLKSFIVKIKDKISFNTNNL